MAWGRLEMSGQGSAEIVFGNITSVNVTVVTPPGMPASNTQVADNIEYAYQKNNMWWWGSTNWSVTVTWDVSTPHVLWYQTRDGLLLRNRMRFWRRKT